MALVNCPECGKENVSDTAVACPDCGFGIREYFERIKQEETTEQTEKKVKEPESEVLKKINEEQLRIQREIEKEEARIREIKEIDEYNKKRAEEIEQRKANASTPKQSSKNKLLVERSLKEEMKGYYALLAFVVGLVVLTIIVTYAVRAQRANEPSSTSHSSSPSYSTTYTGSSSSSSTSVTTDKEQRCWYCSKVIVNSNGTVIHATHDELDMYICDYCGKTNVVKD